MPYIGGAGRYYCCKDTTHTHLDRLSKFYTTYRLLVLQSPKKVLLQHQTPLYETVSRSLSLLSARTLLLTRSTARVTRGMANNGYTAAVYPMISRPISGFYSGFNSFTAINRLREPPHWPNLAATRTSGLFSSLRVCPILATLYHTMVCTRFPIPQQQ